MNDRMTTKVLKTHPRLGAASPIILLLLYYVFGAHFSIFFVGMTFRKPVLDSQKNSFRHFAVIIVSCVHVLLDLLVQDMENEESL